ncbi:hypothetical protein AHAS_Ahas11G0047800 [Arachis hypogaea]
MKKVKTRGEVDLNQPFDCMEIVPVKEKSIPVLKDSYKDTLLTSPGFEGDHEEPFNMDDHEPNPEGKCYQDDEDGGM